MTYKALIKKVTKLEAGKKEVSIAQITEVVGILAELMAKDESVIKLVVKAGNRRLKKSR